MSAKKTGFTLIELLVVLSIVGILAGLVGPSFSNYQRSQALKESTNLLTLNLKEAFSNARSQSFPLGVKGINNDSKFTFYHCDDAICTTQTETIIPLPADVKISPDFDIKVNTPHGDFEFIGTILDVLDLTVHNGDSKTLKIYENSGLISAQ